MTIFDEATAIRPAGAGRYEVLRPEAGRRPLSTAAC